MDKLCVLLDSCFCGRRRVFFSSILSCFCRCCVQLEECGHDCVPSVLIPPHSQPRALRHTLLTNITSCPPMTRSSWHPVRHVATRHSSRSGGTVPRVALGSHARCKDKDEGRLLGRNRARGLQCPRKWTDPLAEAESKRGVVEACRQQLRRPLASTRALGVLWFII